MSSTETRWGTEANAEAIQAWDGPLYDRFVRFHAWQCIALTIVWAAIKILFSIFALAGFHVLLFGVWTLISLAVFLVLFVFWLIALIKASQGQWYKIPIVGDLAASFTGGQP